MCEVSKIIKDDELGIEMICAPKRELVGTIKMLLDQANLQNSALRLTLLAKGVPNDKIEELSSDKFLKDAKSLLQQLLLEEL